MENQNELRHYGVIGMKWGVRRYQKKDGTYTRAGVARYKKAEANYNAAKSNRKVALAKANQIPDDFDESKYQKVNKRTKAEVKEAKRQMNRAYKQLKLDAKADKGAERYRNGQTITGRSATTNALATTGSALLIGSSYLKMMTPSKYSSLSTPVAAAGMAAMGGAFVKGYLDQHGDKQLRAYYSHESQKALDKKVFGDKKTTNPYNRTPMDEKHHASQPVGHVPTADELRKRNHYGI